MTFTSRIFNSKRKHFARRGAPYSFAAMARAMLLMLPNECLHVVLSQVTLQDLAHISMVNKELHRLIQVRMRASTMCDGLIVFKFPAAHSLHQRADLAACGGAGVQSNLARTTCRTHSSGGSWQKPSGAARQLRCVWSGQQIGLHTASTVFLCATYGEQAAETLRRVL